LSFATVSIDMGGLRIDIGTQPLVAIDIRGGLFGKGGRRCRRACPEFCV